MISQRPSVIAKRAAGGVRMGYPGLSCVDAAEDRRLRLCRDTAFAPCLYAVQRGGGPDRRGKGRADDRVDAIVWRGLRQRASYCTLARLSSGWNGLDFAQASCWVLDRAKMTRPFGRVREGNQNSFLGSHLRLCRTNLIAPIRVFPGLAISDDAVRTAGLTHRLTGLAQ